MTLSSRPCILAALALACIPLQAQSQDAGSRIEQVLLFPGGAQVERVQRVPAGAAQARFACLSEHLERDSLQVQAGPGVALGELQILQLPREQLPECQRRDPRLRELEAQRAAAEAELGGLDLALGALKGWSSTEPRGAGSRGAGRCANRAANCSSCCLRPWLAVEWCFSIHWPPVITP